MTSSRPRGQVYASLVKPTADRLLSALAITVLSPLLIAVAGVVKATSRGPVLFSQPRVGRNGELFNVLKFRSMRTFEDSYDENGEELTDRQRVTRVGAVLRRTSIDELPQLLNVLLGQMSLVGPRPALPYQAERYDEVQRERLRVRPGITGLAQVSGRNGLSWGEKIAYDVQYVRNVSLLVDLRIVAKTARAIVSPAGLEFTKHDTLSEHGGDLRRHVGENDPRPGVTLPMPTTGPTAQAANSSRSASTGRRRIVYLHQYYKSPDVSGGTRSHEFAKRLAGAGYDVHIVTSDQAATAARGWRTERRDGYVVHRVGVPYSNRMPYRDRIRAFVRFSIRASGRARSLRGDLIFATSTPLTIIFPAVFARAFRGTPIVFEVRDLWPEMPIALGVLRGRTIVTVSRWLERFAYRAAAHIVALSPGMKAGVVSTGVASHKVSVIPNASDLDLFTPTAPDPNEWLQSHPELHGRTLVVYCGTLGRLNDVGYLAELAARTRETHPKIAFVVVGEGADREAVLQKADRLGVLGASFFRYEPVPKQQVPQVFAAAAVAMSVFLPIEEMESNSANKFFDGLASGRPVAINYGGWQEEVLLTHNAGISLPARDYDAAARLLADIVSDDAAVGRMGRNARSVAEMMFSRDQLAERLLEVFEIALSINHTSPVAGDDGPNLRAASRWSSRAE